MCCQGSYKPSRIHVVAPIAKDALSSQLTTKFIDTYMDHAALMGVILKHVCKQRSVLNVLLLKINSHEMKTKT